MTEAAHTPEATETKVEGWLLKMQQRDLKRDRHGLFTAREIGAGVGLSRDAIRPVLAGLARAGRIRREECANGVFWRSVNPLPWEARVTAAKAQRSAA